MNFSYTPTNIINIVNQAGLKPSRKLGQNFLVDGNLCRFIVDQGELTGSEFVLEVGTGLGQLTHLLAPKAKRVLSYEIDAGLHQLAKDLLSPFDNLELLHESILTHNKFPPSLFEAIETYGPPVVIANFPYSIATVFLLEWGNQKFPFQKMVGLFQKEMGEKLMATPDTSNYGIPSILAQYYFEIESLKILPPQVFWPKPEISSILLKINPKPPHSDLSAKDVDFFCQIVKGGFYLRRKTLANSLAKYFKQTNQRIKTILEKADIDPGLRGEALALEDYIHLTNTFRENTTEEFWSKEA